MSYLNRVPLKALSCEARHLISTLINPPKVIPMPNGMLRDWRGLAQVCSIPGEQMDALACDADPFNKIFNIVQTKNSEFTLKNLVDVLEKVGRWDIIDDSEEVLERDAKLYLEKLDRSETTAKKNDCSADANILTFDDQFRIERGEKEQHYDAFVLYADEDEEFAKEMIDVLENNNNLKLCLKDRDLIAGITFEHEAIMRLISERCNRLITIISPEFIQSPANKFFLNFAQARGIERQERKVIPCVYKDCELPIQLSYLAKIYYNKTSPDFFWSKLVRSIKPTTNLNISKTHNSEQGKNSLVQKQTKKQKKVEIDSSDKIATSRNNYKNGILLPWRKEEKTKSTEMPVKSEEETEDTVLSFPSLEGLESLSSLTINANNKANKTKVKKKFIGTYMKKVQSLLTKS